MTRRREVGQDIPGRPGVVGAHERHPLNPRPVRDHQRLAALQGGEQQRVPRVDPPRQETVGHRPRGGRRAPRRRAPRGRRAPSPQPRDQDRGEPFLLGRLGDPRKNPTAAGSSRARAALAGAVVTLASLLARRPLTGVVWNAVHGGRHPWREDPPSLRAHDLATLAATAVFAARFVVKQWLYLAGSAGWLALAKISMGTPLTVLALLVVIWAFRRSTRRLTEPAGPTS